MHGTPEGKFVTLGDSQEANIFLNALFSRIPENMRFYLWRLSDKVSLWYAPKQIEIAANAAGGKENWYCGVSFVTADLAQTKGEHRRATLKDPAGIVGLWADIDYGDVGHKGAKHGRNNPPTEQDALSILDNSPVAPSIVIHSGNGLQAWWLLREPWIFREDSERQEAQDIATRWMKTIAAIAAQSGWDIDSTHDLSRVLRVPGTFNVKPNAAVKAARILSMSDHRYSVQDLVSRFITPLPKDKINNDIKRDNEIVADMVSNLTINPQAEIPAKKLMAMMMADPLFGRSFQRNRTDSKLKDKSASGYDFSLASYAIRAGWTDQEIVDLIVMSRREAKAEIDTRPSYYARTIANCRSGSEKPKEDEAEVIDEMFSQADEVVQLRSKAKELDKAAVLDTISRMLTIKITKVVRYISSPPYRYRIDTAEFGSIDISSIDKLINQNILRNSLADLCRVVIPRFKNDRWDRLINLIMAVIQDEDAGPSDRDQMSEWIIDYLHEMRVSSDAEDAIREHKPFARGGSVYLFAESFKNWLALERFEGDVTKKALGAALVAAGCERFSAGVNIDGRPTTRSAWRVPRDLAPPLDE